MCLFALSQTAFFKPSAGNGCQINYIKFSTRFISSQLKQENWPVLPNYGGSTFAVISCIRIQQVSSRLGLKTGQQGHLGEWI